ncbi:MAG: hypothetical protein FJ030_05300 [Chloroflexi bacterium]|nr:hypothetical protein [Chloroflexota bacterium]
MRRFILHHLPSPGGSSFILLLALWLLFFWRYLAGQASFPDGDFTQQFFVFRNIAYRALAAGRLPLWADCFFAGYPFHADPQSQLFYPPIWISYAILKLLGYGHFPLFALTLEAASHYLLASLFTFLFLRAELSDQPAAISNQPSAICDLPPLLGAIVFTYGGYLIGYPPLQTAILETIVWLPLLLLSLRRLSASRPTPHALRSTIWPALTLALAFFAGHPQTFLFVAYLSIAYFIHRAALDGRPWRWTLTRLAAIFGLLFGLSLVQLLPQAQYLSLSTRASLSFEELSRGFPLGIVKQFLFTDPMWSPLYIGLAPLALAMLAIAFRGVRAAFWLAVAVVGLLLSFGGNTPVYSIAYWLLPGYRLFRGQERIAALVSFSIAILAALGFDQLLRSISARTRLPAVIVALAVAAATVIDLYSNRTASNLVAPFDPYPPFSILDPIRADPAPFFRVQDDARMQGHFACGYGFKEWGGISPIRPAAWAEFDERAPESLRWKVIGMKYLITWKNGALTRENELPPAERVAEGAAPKGDAKVYRMFEIPRRAWLVHQAQIAADRNSVFAALQTPAFDPFTTAIIRDPQFAIRNAERPFAAAPAPSTLEDSPGRLAFTVTADSPALLVVSEAYYPGWVATVNGQPAPALEADAFLIAIPVPAGPATIELNYRPVAFIVGAIISIIALTIYIALFVASRPSPITNR